MSETLSGFECGPRLYSRPWTAQDEYDDAAVRLINQVKVSMIADRDRMSEALRRGGTYQEMRDAVDAWRVIDEGVRGLEKAVDIVLGHAAGDEEADSD